MTGPSPGPSTPASAHSTLTPVSGACSTASNDDSVAVVIVFLFSMNGALDGVFEVILAGEIVVFCMDVVTGSS